MSQNTPLAQKALRGDDGTFDRFEHRYHAEIGRELANPRARFNAIVAPPPA